MADQIVAYPAVFTPLKNDNDYFIKFPDLEGTFTEGHGLADAYLMASDVLAEMNYNKKNLPAPSAPESLTVPDGAFVAVITANLTAKKRELQKYVRKNVTVLADLAQEAEDKKLNFSDSLNFGLRIKLGKLSLHEIANELEA